MTDPIPPILDYASQPRRPLAMRQHLRIAAAGLTILLVVTSVLCFIVPRFEAIFRDFKTELPTLTKILLATSRWYVGAGWLLGFVICVAIPAIGLWIDSRATTDASIKRYARLIRILAALLLLSFAALTVIALFSPMITLIDSVSGPAKK